MGEDEPAIVATVAKWAGSPCLSTSVTVSTVPVDGAQVMLKGVPATTTGVVVNVNGFCALATAESAARRRGSENCIFVGK